MWGHKKIDVSFFSVLSKNVLGNDKKNYFAGTIVEQIAEMYD